MSQAKAKADLTVHLDPEFMRELRRVRSALERLSPSDSSKVDSALSQVEDEFHTGPVRIVEPLEELIRTHPFNEAHWDCSLCEG